MAPKKEVQDVPPSNDDEAQEEEEEHEVEAEEEEEEAEDYEAEPMEEEEVEEDEEEQNRDEKVEEERNDDSKPDDNSTEGPSSPGKIFIGGLSKDTSTESLSRHFRKYGEIIDSVVMRNVYTGHPRGFGFVTYSDPSVIDKVLEDTHVLDGKTVEIKRTIPRKRAAKENKKEEPSSSPGKIFIGGLSRETTTDTFTKHFSKYGEITDHVIMKDRFTGQPRGFGFVTYADPSVIDKVLKDTHVIDGKTVEIKRTIPKSSSSKRPESRRMYMGGIPPPFAEGYGGVPYGPAGYGPRAGGYMGAMPYGGAEYGRGYGGYGAGYVDDVPRGYGPRYGDGYGPYGMASFDARADPYGPYSDVGYGGAYDSRVGGPYGAGGGSYSGARGRYHPYGR
eukprot:TRINITY_DN37677_c0_g1_i1.p1 TRINITY_DN37677_c0_g1~~TRINITY_DN37677_c0_g1_i1.p1  ORF type:complete len:390 (+),score=79.59 TRINITY_DN37677_c0_g1_i1:135-1304(+)